MGDHWEESDYQQAEEDWTPVGCKGWTQWPSYGQSHKHKVRKTNRDTLSKTFVFPRWNEMKLTFPEQSMSLQNLKQWRPARNNNKEEEGGLKLAQMLWEWDSEVNLGRSHTTRQAIIEWVLNREHCWIMSKVIRQCTSSFGKQTKPNLRKLRKIMFGQLSLWLFSVKLLVRKNQVDIALDIEKGQINYKTKI